MKRTITAVAAALMLAASGVYAQAPAAPAKPEVSPFSPLVYDALGATPKVQLRRKAAPAPKAEELRKADVARPGTAPAADQPAVQAATQAAIAAPAATH